MNNFSSVFRVIKAHCEQAGAANEDCFTALKESVTGRQFFLSLYLYLEVLQSLGLIIFHSDTNRIMLTEKGKNADDHLVFGLHAFALLFLYFTRDVFLLLLFWPMLLMVQKPYGREEEKNSAG